MFSRREVVKPEVLDVGVLARDLERLLNRTLSERIALRIAIGPDLVPVLADRAQLEQVLVNLAVNARDAMPAGGTLSIGVSGTEAGVRLTVSDDGTGMPAGGRASAPSSRSSRRRRRATAPGSGWRPSTASSPRRAGRSRSTPCRGRGPP